MKKTYNILWTALLLVILTSCKKDNILVTYPESYPVIDNAEVIETSIIYGDSITLNVSISDKTTPLSTLEVQVVVNNEAVSRESIRTKGNSSTVTRRYCIPFVANRPDNEDVKVYLSSINVDGYETDTILNSTKASRPEISELWLVPTKGNSYKLDLIDSTNLIYYTKGMDFSTTVSYYLATKVTKFKKVDWTGLVFGKVGNGIGLISERDDSLTSTDATLVGISELTFDALKFEVKVGGKLLEPVTTLDINADLAPITLNSTNFLGGSFYFGKDVEVTFTGLSNLSNNVAPDYFEVTGTNTAKFLGPTGVYKAYYLIESNYLYIEPLSTVIYPDALWICGTGFGRPSTPYATTASWNWRSPTDYAPCRLVTAGVYQVTIYVKNEDDGKGFGTLDFKFFHKQGWWDGHEEDASTYTVQTPIYGLNSPGKMGNCNGMTTPFEGVYRFTIDVNAKTITSEKLN